MTKRFVVSDSSTLILLVKAGFVEEAVREFSVFIPGVVFQESVERGKEKGRLDALTLDALVNEGLLNVKEPSKKNIDRIKKQFNLHEGELHALALALDVKADFLLTDDLKAINACRVLNIKFITAISLLMEFYEKNILDLEKAKKCFNSLEDFGWYAPKIIRICKGKISGGVKK